MTAEQLRHESLRFGNQFFLDPSSALEDLHRWQHVPIRGTWHIVAHPGLRTVTLRRDGAGDSDEVILDAADE